MKPIQKDFENNDPNFYKAFVEATQNTNADMVKKQKPKKKPSKAPEKKTNKK